MVTRPDAARFRLACGQYATGVTVCTVLGPDGTPHGLTANSFTSVSLEPPIILICVDHKANVHPFFELATHFGVHVLREDQVDLSIRFAERGLDRFDGLAWKRGVTGAPLLPNTLAVFECRVQQRLAAGDHTVFFGEVLHATHSEGSPLVYFRGRYGTAVPAIGQTS